MALLCSLNACNTMQSSMTLVEGLKKSETLKQDWGLQNPIGVQVNIVDNEQIKVVRPVEHSKNDVLSLLGQPMRRLVFFDQYEVWQYLCQPEKGRELGFFQKLGVKMTKGEENNCEFLLLLDPKGRVAKVRTRYSLTD